MNADLSKIGNLKPGEFFRWPGENAFERRSGVRFVYVRLGSGEAPMFLPRPGEAPKKYLAARVPTEVLDESGLDDPSLFSLAFCEGPDESGEVEPVSDQDLRALFSWKPALARAVLDALARKPWISSS